MSDVEHFYDLDPQHEWDRLDKNRTEYAVTMRALAEYSPAPPARILDIGGGPGRYAIALAHQGYEVTLLDLSEKSLLVARHHAEKAGVTLEQYKHGNAVDLHFPGETFDVVLLMGPLYHLIAAKDRKKAVSEAMRVLKNKGMICAAFITRLAPLRWAGKYEPSWVQGHLDQCNQLIAEGVAELEPGEESFVNYAYFAHPAEVTPFMEGAGCTTVDVVACEGIVSFIDEKINELTGSLWEIWVDLNYRLGKDPTVHGAAEHLLYIGKK